ncbi:MAG TPA: hypothetical protein PLP10_02990 [Caldisericia bacterium]|nr:hypothetical protein [Caldisericia bacterium]
MKDRFRIKRRKEFKLSYKTKRAIILSSFLIFYLLLLFIFSPNGEVLKDGFDVPPLTSNIEIFNDKIVYSSSKTLYTMDNSLSISFPYNIIDFKVYEDRIYILSDHLTIIDSNFKIIKEIKKDGFFPQDIYFFDNDFCLRWDGVDKLKIILSLYDIKNYKELKKLSFDEFSFMPFMTIFDNGNKILVFQNDGDIMLLNFSGEIIWQKNIRPENIIVFDPHGVVNEETGRIILYWRSYAYNTNIILILNMEGEILKRYDLKNNINKLFSDENNIYLITNDDVEIITSQVFHKESIPFYKPTDSFFIDKNLINIWEFVNFVSNYKFIMINNKKIFFKGNVKDILIDKDKLYILIDSNIYNINIYD